MKKYIITVIALAVLIAGMTIKASKTEEAVIVEPVIEVPTLSHRQEVWLGALEWCESRGNTKAVNPNDRDNTPSYGAFQFKPDTFFYYGEKYKGINYASTGESDEVEYKQMMDMVMNYELQRSIVEQMILHHDEIRWTRQFPDCVKKLGIPPKN